MAKSSVANEPVLPVWVFILVLFALLYILTRCRGQSESGTEAEVVVKSTLSGVQKDTKESHDDESAASKRKKERMKQLLESQRKRYLTLHPDFTPPATSVQTNLLHQD